MHAVIRIVAFLIFTLCIVFGGYPELVFGIAIMSIGYLFSHPRIELWQMNLQMLKRMKWLFLSLLIVYLWFTPGSPILFNIAGASPTWQGLQLGGLKIGSLIIIVLAVNLLIRPTSKEALICGLLWWLTPLRWFGVPNERLAVRIVLTFNMIAEMQYEYELLRRSGENAENSNAKVNEPSRFLWRLDYIGQTGASLINFVLDKANAVATPTIELPEETGPPLHQWLLPIALLGGFECLKMI